MRIRAAASSMASGSPSRRAQISAMAAALSAVSAKAGCRATAWRTNSATAGLRASASSGGSRAMSGTGSGRTGMHCSPDTCRTAWLVTSSVSAVVDSIRSTSSGAAASSCSKLSRTSSVRSRIVARTWARRASATEPRSMRDSPSAWASVGATSAASASEPRLTNDTPPGKSAAASAATCSARRVLPLPPGPASVNTRAPPPRRAPRIAATSASRPIRVVRGTGSGAAGASRGSPRGGHVQSGRAAAASDGAATGTSRKCGR